MSRIWDYTPLYESNINSCNEEIDALFESVESDIALYNALNVINEADGQKLIGMNSDDMKDEANKNKEKQGKKISEKLSKIWEGIAKFFRGIAEKLKPIAEKIKEAAKKLKAKIIRDFDAFKNGAFQFEIPDIDMDKMNKFSYEIDGFSYLMEKEKRSREHLTAQMRRNPEKEAENFAYKHLNIPKKHDNIEKDAVEKFIKSNSIIVKHYKEPFTLIDDYNKAFTDYQSVINFARKDFDDLASSAEQEADYMKNTQRVGSFTRVGGLTYDEYIAKAKFFRKSGFYYRSVLSAWMKLNEVFRSKAFEFMKLNPKLFNFENA